jgi:UDP-N-acetylmuramoyl-L-alanyl-D-glutamate--2,6-diaminopimelate ligase
MRDMDADAVVMEVSSHALAQHRTEGIPINLAIFTNLTQDHLDFHGDMEAYFQAKGAASSVEFAQADSLLSEALAWMKNGWEGFNTVTQLLTLRPGIMTREDREECWAAWKEAKDLLRLRRDEFFAEIRERQIGRWSGWI